MIQQEAFLGKQEAFFLIQGSNDQYYYIYM